MSVKIVLVETGETISGKYAVQEEGKVHIFSGIMSDKKGGFRGCGKKRVFDASAVRVAADEPALELKQR